MLYITPHMCYRGLNMGNKLSNSKSKYTRLLSNTVLFGISTFSSKVLSFLLTRLYTGVLEQGSFGVVDLITSSANLLIPLVSLGISNAVIRFGLEKGVSKKGVFTGGLFAIFSGFLILLALYPVAGRVALISDYVVLLYIYVLVSCLRTLACQFVRAQLYTRLYAIDGILSTAYTVGFNILFLVYLDMGPTGYLLAIICADALSTIGLTIVAKLWKYAGFRGFDRRLYKQMLKYSLPLVPAMMFWWITNASDRFFIAYMKGPEMNGLYAAAYKVPSIVALLSTIFTEAWQLSAVTDGQDEGRHDFFSKIFGVLMAISFVVGGGLILGGKMVMRVLVAPGYFEAWRFIPLLIVATIFSCFVQFFNSVYMVAKESNRSLFTMMIGAIANLILNWIMIPKFGPNGASFATLISYIIVFIIRVVDSRKYIRVNVAPAKLAANTVLILTQAFIMIYQVDYWMIWCSLLLVIMAVINFVPLFSGVRQLVFGRRSNKRGS